MASGPVKASVGLYGRTDVPVTSLASCSHRCQAVAGFRPNKKGMKTRAAPQVAKAFQSYCIALLVVH